MSQETSSLNARVQGSFPDHRLDLSFPICLPVYELRVRVTVLAEHRLSTVARFVLQLIELGVSTPIDIVEHLGLPRSMVPGVAAELLKQELVRQRPDQRIEMTERGREVLDNDGVSMRSQNRHPRLPYDPLTRRVADVDIDDIVERSFVRRQGLYVVSSKPQRPKVNQLQFDEVRRYCGTHDMLRPGQELIDVVDIKDVKLKYRQDVHLYRLMNNATSKPKYVAYRDTIYLAEESAALQRLADKGLDLIPDDLRRPDLTTILSNTSVTKEEFGLLEAIEEADRSIDVKGGDVGGEYERARATELTERLTKDMDGRIRLVRTEEHRSLLLRAIQEAKQQLTLVSAWIRPRAFDEELAQMLCAAVERGVSVRIAWGLGTTRGAENERNRVPGRDALRRLKERIPSKLRRRLIERRTETHEKYIICDNSFCAVGSFNWLSYRGELDEGYRREVSFYTEREEDVSLLKAQADELFRSSDP